MAKRKYTFTKRQMEALARYESDLSTSYRSHYCSAITSAEAKEVHDILLEATGNDMRANSSCGACTYNLMRVAGGLYFKQKEAEAADKEAKK